MPIQNRSLGAVRDALNLSSTTEADFRNAEGNIAFQVDANQVDINVDRRLILTGDVTANIPYNLGDDAVRDIMIPTVFGPMAIDGSDINPNSITSNQIQPNSITSAEISTDSRRTFQVLSSGGGVLFTIDGLIPGATT